MEIERFDAITSSFAERSTRRGALRGLAAVAFGVGGLAFLGSDEIAAKKKRKKKKGGSHHSGGSRGSAGAAAPAAAAIAAEDQSASATPIPPPAAPRRKARSADVSESVEGNNVCVNSGADNVCETAVECTSTDGPEATLVPQPGRLPLLLPGSQAQRQPVLWLWIRDGHRTSLRAGVRQHIPVLGRCYDTQQSPTEIPAPRRDLGHFGDGNAQFEGIDNGARRVYVHCTPNADGSNPESGRPANADEARAQARNLSAFCCVRDFRISRSR